MKTANSLVNSFLLEYNQGYGLGSMTGTVYDTAWISCISKPMSDSGFEQWLFPPSFCFVLDAQDVDGGWRWPPQQEKQCIGSTVLTSLAALFAITQHIRRPLQLATAHGDLSDRLARGIKFVAQKLRLLDHVFPDNVGFEVLVPALLELLEQEDIRFQFPNRSRLFRWRDAKLSRINVPDFEKVPSTLLHSLETFYADSRFSFAALGSRLVAGSMMGSPAATAAYLMRCDGWDDTAESYLRLVISNGLGHCSGSVPSAFPSTNFEMIWVRTECTVAEPLVARFLTYILRYYQRC